MLEVHVEGRGVVARVLTHEAAYAVHRLMRVGGEEGYVLIRYEVKLPEPVPFVHVDLGALAS